MAAEFKVEVDAQQFSELLGKTSKLAPKLKAKLRKDIKTAAAGVVSDMRAEVGKAPLEKGKHPQNRGLRAAIAGDIKVVISANSSKGAGVTVKAGASRLAGDRKKLVRAYNSPKGWRHPIFAQIHKKSRTVSTLTALGANKEARQFTKAQENRRRAGAKWVHQMGRPYFFNVLKQHRSRIKTAVEVALREALGTLH
jgi:hypothetical protein